ncbi:AAA family ATPase, partial [Caballeronia sp. GAOx1]|uniref:AAA family ATPase n=1 Tax=Caballeronia sp. GAOx1 TaxID=2921761 RepID=UPI0032EF5561
MINAGRAKLLEDYNEPLRIVMIDTLSASAMVEDENTSGDMQRAISNLTKFAKKAEVLIVLVHHSEKTGKEMRGSS